ncbi:hypothetical protein MPSEU_000126200 [Mayamaea pseudoterrestris]|nr:hypothetical protein MPSEU_000124900 [Mayamaea pseudoterrestris]GKY91541.1 hypothetical protein MPSEU_000126200 [Mayamaea pseudoterrestris]
MMCKAGSQSLLAKGSSISSLKSLSPSSSVSESGGRRLGQGLSRMQRSSSSLYLHGMSFESSASSRGNSFSSQLQSSNKFKLQSDASDTKKNHSIFHEAGGAKLAPYILLLALAIQIPTIFDELVEAIDQHLHSIPLLVMFGIVPSVFWMRGKKHSSMNAEDDAPRSREEFLSMIRSMASVESVNQYEETQPTPRFRPSSDAPAFDEWGHFAELDETALEEKDVCFIMSPSSSRRSSTSLGTLPEELDEEDDFSF